MTHPLTGVGENLSVKMIEPSSTKMSLGFENLSAGSIDSSGRVRTWPARLGQLNPVPRLYPRTQVHPVPVASHLGVSSIDPIQVGFTLGPRDIDEGQARTKLEASLLQIAKPVSSFNVLLKLTNSVKSSSDYRVHIICLQLRLGTWVCFVI